MATQWQRTDKVRETVDDQCTAGIATVSLRFFFFSSRRRHTRFDCDWSSDVCSSDLRHKGVDALRPGEAISIEDLDGCAARERVSVEPGDIVLVRTGDVGRRLRERSWGTFSAGDAPGLSFLTAPWLYEKRIAGLATDTW